MVTWNAPDQDRRLTARRSAGSPRRRGHGCPESGPRGGNQEGTLNAGSAEARRLEEARDPRVAWKKWGPYLSERQWGTVREDSGATGNTWSGCTHDQARSVAYRFGEDGLAGFSDDQQRLCFAVALWNGRDPILKERLFGLTSHEGNHGEDVSG
jgi:hypothetical protein